MQFMIIWIKNHQVGINSVDFWDGFPYEFTSYQRFFLLHYSIINQVDDVDIPRILLSRDKTPIDPLLEIAGYSLSGQDLSIVKALKNGIKQSPKLVAVRLLT